VVALSRAQDLSMVLSKPRQRKKCYDVCMLRVPKCHSWQHVINSRSPFHIVLTSGRPVSGSRPEHGPIETETKKEKNVMMYVCYAFQNFTPDSMLSTLSHRFISSDLKWSPCLRLKTWAWLLYRNRDKEEEKWYDLCYVVYWFTVKNSLLLYS